MGKWEPRARATQWRLHPTRATGYFGIFVQTASGLCWGAAAGVLVALLVTAPAQAVTIKGGDAAHRNAALSVLRSQPQLLAFVESVYPDFTVWIGYGGHAWEGRIDVTGTRWGKAFADQVAHEFCHEVQRAADAAGGSMALGNAWLNELASQGHGPDTWVWGMFAPLYRQRDPWESFAENLKRAYFSPYYTLTTTPNTQLGWLSRDDMAAFLQANGIQPEGSCRSAEPRTLSLTARAPTSYCSWAAASAKVPLFAAGEVPEPRRRCAQRTDSPRPLPGRHAL